MSLEYIRNAYGVDATFGGRVRFKGGREGQITGANGPHLMVMMDGDTDAFPYHPTWQMEYLPTKEQP